MTDPKTFYNKEDLWEIPSHAEKSMEPYYLIMKLPGEKGEEYVLLAPYTPAKRDNLAAWFAARCDTPNYGKLIVYTFPRDRLVYGPRQIDARIDQDSYISQQLTPVGPEEGRRSYGAAFSSFPSNRPHVHTAASTSPPKTRAVCPTQADHRSLRKQRRHGRDA
jgi:uncharacterized membrane protein (UPF0182 family)